MDLYAYQTFRVVYEATSAILCLILVRFMIKPYQVTEKADILDYLSDLGFLEQPTLYLPLFTSNQIFLAAEQYFFNS